MNLEQPEYDNTNEPKSFYNYDYIEIGKDTLYNSLNNNPFSDGASEEYKALKEAESDYLMALFEHKQTQELAELIGREAPLRTVTTVTVIVRENGIPVLDAHGKPLTEEVDLVLDITGSELEEFSIDETTGEIIIQSGSAALRMIQSQAVTDIEPDVDQRLENILNNLTSDENIRQAKQRVDDARQVWLRALETNIARPFKNSSIDKVDSYFNKDLLNNKYGTEGIFGKEKFNINNKEIINPFKNEPKVPNTSEVLGNMILNILTNLSPEEIDDIEVTALLSGSDLLLELIEKARFYIFGKVPFSWPRQYTENYTHDDRIHPDNE